CGVAYEVAQDCGSRLCRDGECEPPPPRDCGGEPILGRCDGELARGCEGGYPFAIDCAALGRRCVTTDEGPVCRPAEEVCDPLLEPARCEDDTLVTCTNGQRMRTDCRAHAAICGRPPGRSAPTCVQRSPPVRLDGCDDPCGCPEHERGDEICNGIDDDEDGFIDEGVECPPLDLVVFVIVDADGSSPYEPQEIDAEIDRLARSFARSDDYGLELRVAEVVRLAAPEWLEIDGAELGALVRQVEGSREELFVPVVLTERVLVDGVPRPGLSTVPNGECGGQRRVPEPQPPLGVVAMAKHHWDTTLAHELGHFLGLCHTHGDQPAPIVAVDDDRSCAPECTLEGDGVCDTPPDPGPGPCLVDLQCQVACRDGATPDPTNIMGYYPQCRVGFSEQQALLMRQTVAKRRAWHRCVGGDGCPCTMGGNECPPQMSCRRFVSDGGTVLRCALDGPAVPGGVCTGSLECSQGAVCIGQPDAESRCVRPCDDQTPGCRCVEVEGVSHPICIGDLRRDDE
ncbi:MAG: hypothetical protein KC501_39660, partial [Myxococcales bacterium]|nr:hypothetical protein [Myxococcales bacterium]